MALTGRLTASIYSINQNQNGAFGSNGKTFNLPAALCEFYPETGSYNGVTTNSVILLLPTGLNQPPTKFYTDSTVAQIISAGT
jgi:hypothetical protein